jgi:hypothetical protein
MIHETHLWSIFSCDLRQFDANREDRLRLDCADFRHLVTTVGLQASLPAMQNLDDSFLERFRWICSSADNIKPRMNL